MKTFEHMTKESIISTMMYFNYSEDLHKQDIIPNTRYLWMGNMFFVTSDVLGYITITQK